MESSPNCTSNIKRIYVDSIHPEIIRKPRMPEEIENYLIPLNVLNIKNRIWRSSWISLMSTFYSVYYRTPDVRWLKIWSRVLNMMAFDGILLAVSFLRAEIWILTEVTTSSWPISWHHSISLSTDSPVENHNPAIFHDPTGTENLTSHPKQTKSLNNSNMCTY